MTRDAGTPEAGTPDAGTDRTPAQVDRRGFLKVAGAVAASTAVATGIAARVLTRPEPATHVVARRHEGDIPADHQHRAWARAQAWVVPLLVQNLVAPHAPALVIPELRVRALHNGERIALLVEWADDAEDAVDSMARFRDAVAVQLPVDTATTPGVTMGAVNQPVHIMQWRAAWQRDVDRGRQGVREAFPNSFRDAAPEDLMGEEAAQQFYPALVANNPMARRDRTSPVEDLSAVGFGSLTAQDKQTATGRGVFDRGWHVVLSTPLAAGEHKTSLHPGLTTSIAFAVWDGGAGNRGSRKQWSNWTDLELEA
ncbi:MAG: ethylbenzene dehydrogenase-related protein [Dehalococcoidia bacterium]|nr:ethylbenzene dehydrogenase-related protein [Dehalococcoidia bacterium]